MDQNAISPDQSRQTWDSLAATIKKKTTVKKTSPLQRESKVEFICDLSTMQMFSSPFSTAAPIPVIASYGIDSAHRFSMRNRDWDFHRILVDKKDQICRSDRYPADSGIHWRDLIIAEENKVFIHRISELHCDRFYIGINCTDVLYGRDQCLLCGLICAIEYVCCLCIYSRC